MTNENVIKIIDRLMKQKTDKLVCTPNEVFAAIVHGYYYIRPGKNTVKFLGKMDKVLKDAWKERPKMYVESKDGIPFEDWLWGKMAGEALCVAQSMFDEEYYSSQIAIMSLYEKYDDHLLERYLYWLDDEEMEHVFEGIVSFKRQFDVFISDENFENMVNELKAKSLAVISETPCYATMYDEHKARIEYDWSFATAYLSKEDVVNAICRYVDEDPLMLASMIKAFKYSDTHTAAEYTALALWLANGFELDVFHPVMTDMESIALETLNAVEMTAMQTKGIGNFMMGSLTD